MGKILSQTFKSSIYSYLGVIVGFLTTVILMPRFLSTSEIGVIRQIQYYALFISSVLAFGIPDSLVRMFPHFRDPEKKHFGFATLLTLITISSAIIFWVLFVFFGETFLEKDIEKSPLFGQYYRFIIPFTLATLFFSLYDSYATANQESTIGVFLKDFVLRILMLGVIAAYSFGGIFNFSELISTTTYIQFIPVGLILLFLFSKNLIHITSTFSFPSEKVKKEFFSASAFNWINGLSAVAVVTIDSIMLSKMTDSSSVGIYTTVTFFASLMLIPNKNLGKIATSILANHFKSENWDSIQSIYKKSAFTPYILGLFIFGNLVLLLPFIFQILLKPEFAAGTWVLIFISLSNLFKMGTGVKFSLIFNSNYYRWSTAMFMSFVVLLVATNLWLIPMYGINGAALASFISTTIFHLMGLVLVRNTFGYWPFDYSFIRVSLIFLVISIPVYFVPDFSYPILLSVLKSGFFSATFLVIIYIKGFSSEINEPIQSLLEKVKSKL
jgi:O-antigen/teichoic acid export membrane protein